MGRPHHTAATSTLPSSSLSHRRGTKFELRHLPPTPAVPQTVPTRAGTGVHLRHRGHRRTEMCSCKKVERRASAVWRTKEQAKSIAVRIRHQFRYVVPN